MSCGITISFGILDIVNIAHPAFIILGSYVAYIVNVSLGIDPILTAIVMTPAFYLLGAGMRILAANATLGLTEHHVTSYVRFAIPYPRMEGIAPDGQMWWSTATVVGLLYAASYLFSKKFTPVTYLLRAVLLIQITALVYFLFFAASFPHSPDSYMEGLVTYQIALISAVPMLFGLTYYVFKFGLIKKIALTVLTMAHLSLFLPLQILLQAIVLQKSVLFMPMLYIVFGLPLDIFMILAFYSWGMNWTRDPNVKRG